MYRVIEDHLRLFNVFINPAMIDMNIATEVSSLQRTDANRQLFSQILRSISLSKEEVSHRAPVCNCAIGTSNLARKI